MLNVGSIQKKKTQYIFHVQAPLMSNLPWHS
jgi:hypothetical protein